MKKITAILIGFSLLYACKPSAVSDDNKTDKGKPPLAASIPSPEIAKEDLAAWQTSGPAFASRVLERKSMFPIRSFSDVFSSNGCVNNAPILDGFGIVELEGIFNSLH